MNKPPRGISGRWFTICFGVLLALGVVLGFSSVIRFQETMNALDTVRSVWPDAATVLEERYQVIDGLLVKLDGVEADNLKSRLADWEQARRQFKSSTLYDVQARVVPSLEAIVSHGKLDHEIEPQRIPASASLEKFLQADRTLAALQSDALGWLCKLLFRLKLPAPVFSILE
jgi:hypothetical protein